MLIIAILIMAIGFAAISTTLIINGSAKVSENTEDFSVIFTSATLDGVDVYNQVIDSTKKIITFETSDLKTLNQTSVLNYEVTNSSSNYDAEIQISCKLKNNTEAKYTSIKNELENNATVVKAKETLDGTLTVTLNKTSTEEVNEEYVCTLEFKAAERDTLGEKIVSWGFEYTGNEQIFVIPKSGTYKLEIWGASGGYAYDPERLTGPGGYGGYSIGNIYLKKATNLYLNIGGKGEDNCQTKTCVGGYNGGSNSAKWANYDGNGLYTAGGGGATHIALSSGLLSNLENSKSDIIIVSGGGGGGDYYPSWNNSSTGSNGGGYIGGNTITIADKTERLNTGGTQTNGASFGKALTTYTKDSTGGSGGGFYGGNSLYQHATGAGGSGYIGNSLLTEKVMYCYNCTESAEESTKTISTTCVNEEATENCAKQGNGYARITLIS